MYQRAMDTDGQPFCAIESANHILSARFCYASTLDSVDSDHLLPTHLEVIPKRSGSWVPFIMRGLSCFASNIDPNMHCSGRFLQGAYISVLQFIFLYIPRSCADNAFIKICFACQSGLLISVSSWEIFVHSAVYENCSNEHIAACPVF